MEMWIAIDRKKLSADDAARALLDVASKLLRDGAAGMQGMNLITLDGEDIGTIRVMAD